MLVLIQFSSHMSYHVHLSMLFPFSSLNPFLTWLVSSYLSPQRYCSICLEWNLGLISGSGGGNWLEGAQGKSFGCHENVCFFFLISVMVVISCLYISDNHQNLHMKRGDFTALTFYIRKGDS